MTEPTHVEKSPVSETVPLADNDNADDTNTTATTPTAAKHPPLPPANGHQRQVSEIDRDAQDMVITSLRSQIEDLISQVTQLNGKLVKSYDRVSDLEDELHVAASNLRASSVKVSQLELERTQHLAALNTGLLVEKSHVTTELNRLMEKATEEAAQRGQAESARVAIEKELDDLSASLFNQANTMVAEARYERALSERKVEEAESALKGAEEAVSIMQQQMQAMQEEKEQAEKAAERMQVAMGKGKWVERYTEGPSNLPRQTRLLSIHAPYSEFLAFVAHLRTIHPASPQLPSITSLLQLPFLARIMTEDSEPTLRLDLAPQLNWLSRRSVLAAIHSGQLIIEPVTSTTLLNDGSYSNGIVCALCGTSVYTPPESGQSGLRLAGLPLTGKAVPNSWSTSLFKKSVSAPATPILTQSSRFAPTPSPQPPPHQLYIFRLSTPASQTPIHHHPHHHSSSSGSTSSTPVIGQSHLNGISSAAGPSQSTIYPLCTAGWCLTRLRATCTMWAFIRLGVVEKIWEEEVPTLLPPPPSTVPSSPAFVHAPMASTIAAITSSGTPPPVPSRKRGLWGTMATAFGEKAASWGGDEKRKAQSQSSSPSLPSKALPDVTVPASAPPPAPPSVPVTRAVPPLPPSPAPKLSGSITDSSAPSVVPPPLPSRSRQRTGTVSHGSGPPPLPPRANGVVGSSPPAGAAAPPTTKSQVLSSETILEEESSPTEESGPSAAVAAETMSTTDTTVTTTASTTANTEETPSTSISPEPAPRPAGVPVPIPTSTEPNPVKALASSPPSQPQSPRKPASRPTSPPVLPPRARPKSVQAPVPIHPSSTNGIVIPPARAGTPSSIPLPDSRPGTPSSPPTAGIVPLRSPARPGHLRQRSASPASVPPARSGSPTPGASGAPPPVPRRAAARARPVSSQLAGPPVTADTPSVEKTAAVTSSPAGEKKSDAASANVDRTLKAPSSSLSPLPIPLSATPSSASDVDEFVDAQEVVSGGEEKAKEEAEGQKEKKEEGAENMNQVEGVSTGNAQAEDTAAGVNPSVNGDDEAAKEDEKKSVEVLPPAEEPLSVHFDNSHAETDTILHEEREEERRDEDGRDYIGDTTWEERTWKEIVRLKEEMFWAKIGAVRSAEDVA